MTQETIQTIATAKIMQQQIQQTTIQKKINTKGTAIAAIIVPKSPITALLHSSPLNPLIQSQTSGAEQLPFPEHALFEKTTPKQNGILQILPDHFSAKQSQLFSEMQLPCPLQTLFE
jgi:hypothetical protein